MIFSIDNLIEKYIKYKIQIDNTEDDDKKKKLQIEMCYIEDLLNESDIPEHIINNLKDDLDHLKLNEKKETLKEKDEKDE